MYSGSRRYQGVRYVTQYVPIDISSGTSTNIQSDKTVTITSNGTTTIQPDSGYDAMSEVSVTTNVSGGMPINIKSISQEIYTDPPAAEIIPLSNFTLVSTTTGVTIPANSALIDITGPNGQYPGQISVFYVSSQASRSVLSGHYYYILTYTGTTTGYVSFLDSNNHIVFYALDVYDEADRPTLLYCNPNYIAFDFSS